MHHYYCNLCGVYLPNGTKLAQHLLEKHKLPFSTTTQATFLNGRVVLTPRTKYAQKTDFPQVIIQIERLSRQEINRFSRNRRRRRSGHRDCGDSSDSDSEIEILSVIEPVVDPSQKCTVCGEKFISLETHMERHGAAVKCPYCPAGYKHQIGLLLHLKKMHRDRGKDRFKCQKCPKNFFTQEHLERHHERNHVGRHKCTQCPASFFTTSTLKNHENAHGTKQMCKICSAGFKVRVGLLKHKRQFHPQVRKVIGVRIQETQNYVSHRQKQNSNSRRSVDGAGFGLRSLRKLQPRRYKDDDDDDDD